MALNKMIINVWTKLIIDFGHGKSKLNKDVGFRPTKYEACQVNKIFLDEYNKKSLNKYDKAKQKTDVW